MLCSWLRRLTHWRRPLRAPRPTQLAIGKGFRPGPSRPSAPLFLEALEDRTVPSKTVPGVLFDEFPQAQVSDGGGPLIGNVKVELVFWGKGWNKDQTTVALMQSMEEKVQVILQSPYLNGLSQYRKGAIKGGSYQASVSVATSSPGATFTEAQGVAFLQANMQNGTLPKPDTDPNLLYVVVTQPGSSSDLKYGGVHRFATFGQTTFHYALLANPAAKPETNTIDYLSLVFSHELVEAVSDPELNAIQLNPRSASNELSDNSALLYAYRLDGALVQSYWSQQDFKFIVPTGLQQDFVVTRGRTLVLPGDQLANPNDNMSSQGTAAGGVTATMNGDTVQFDPCNLKANGFPVDPCQIKGVTFQPNSGNDTITLDAVRNTLVNAGTGDDTINLLSNTINTLTTVKTGQGTNTVNVADPANGLLEKPNQGTISIAKKDATKGKLLVNYNDQAYQGSGPYTIGAGSLRRPGSKSGTVRYNLPSTADVITLNAGGQDETIDIYTIPSTTALNINGAGGMNTAVIHVGATLSTKQVTFTNIQTLQIDGGTLTVNTAFAMNSVLVKEGTLKLAANTLTAAGGFKIEAKGTLSGAGSVVGNVTNAGQVSPGQPGVVGRITITGDYTQAAGGTLTIKIGGTDPNMYDRLVVSKGAAGGTASLDGTLKVVQLGKFTPAEGDKFEVLDFVAKKGDFANLTTNFQLGKKQFKRVYGADNLTLKVGG
jgi:hypothetical protein